MAYILAHFNVKMTLVHLGARCLQDLLVFFESFLNWIGYFFDSVGVLVHCLWLEIAC